ncbi:MULTISPECIES: hypothetical protein [unclassified Streptomyces]|uniref:hypothetical protein n=1 Tax=unclassified Streptomyces TaxID=2593676 RepID=UPI00380C727D
MSTPPPPSTPTGPPTTPAEPPTETPTGTPSETPTTEGKPATAEATGTETAEPGPSQGLARRTVTRVAAGGRHLVAGLRHRVLTGHQSDEEIRRILVQRQLVAYEELRENAGTELDDVRARISKVELLGAEDGWTPEQRHTAKALRDERKRREQALRDLTKQSFAAVQPTAAQIKRARHVGSTQRFVGLVVVLAAITALIVVRPQLLLLALPGAVVALWWVGRQPPTLAQRAVPERLLARPELAPPAKGADAPGGEDEEELQPYPIAEATTPEEAEEALRRAIVREGGDIESVTGGRREPWGWSARAVFNTGSPDQLNEGETYRNLITLLRLRRNGLLIETDPEAGAACDVRLVQRDPFTPEVVGPVPYRAPRSTSILDVHDFGVAMDATQLAYSLAGLMLLMVADSGGAKSGVMLAMAEAATSTRDAIVVNIDPVGTGVGDLGPAITLDATMDEKKITAVLKFLLKLCTARARQRAAYGWGNKWRVSPEHPAFCVFVDEWPQLSDKNKALFIRVLLLGRKEALWFYGAAQFGTKEYLGAAIGPKLSARMLGPCRRADVTELLGPGTIAEGYRPDLLRAATHTARNDAGQIYAQGLPGLADRAMRYQVREVTPDYAARVGAERAADGLPDVTHTLTEAGLIDAWRALQTVCADMSLAADSDESEEPAGDVPPILLTIISAFVQEDDPAYLTMDQLHTQLRKEDPDRWGRWHDKDDQGRLRELGKALSRELREAGVELSSEKLSELKGAPRGYRLDAVQRALQSAS